MILNSTQSSVLPLNTLPSQNKNSHNHQNTQKTSVSMFANTAENNSGHQQEKLKEVMTANPFSARVQAALDMVTQSPMSSHQAEKQSQQLILDELELETLNNEKLTLTDKTGLKGGMPLFGRNKDKIMDYGIDSESRTIHRSARAKYDNLYPTTKQFYLEASQAYGQLQSSISRYVNNAPNRSNITVSEVTNALNMEIQNWKRAVNDFNQDSDYKLPNYTITDLLDSYGIR